MRKQTAFGETRPSRTVGTTTNLAWHSLVLSSFH